MLCWSYGTAQGHGPYSEGIRQNNGTTYRVKRRESCVSEDYEEVERTEGGRFA